MKRNKDQLRSAKTMVRCRPPCSYGPK